MVIAAIVVSFVVTFVDAMSRQQSARPLVVDADAAAAAACVES